MVKNFTDNNGAPILEKTIYLAYGSNMDIAQMEERCPGAVLLGRAEAVDLRLVFRRSGSGYYASLDGEIGVNTPAVLWAISEDDVASLDRYEGYPEHYYREYRNTLYNNELLRAMVYLLPEGNKKGKPSKEYEACLRGAYKHFGFDLSVLEDALNEQDLM